MEHEYEGLQILRNKKLKNIIIFKGLIPEFEMLIPINKILYITYTESIFMGTKQTLPMITILLKDYPKKIELGYHKEFSLYTAKKQYELAIEKLNAYKGN